MKDWKPYNDPSGPQLEGISAGKFEGVECYVGRGSYMWQLAPGSLFVEDSKTHSAGFYMEYSSEEKHITSGFEYFAKEPSCSYKWVKSSDGKIIQNAIQYSSNGELFYVGRVFTNDSWLVGKVSLKWNKMHYGKGSEVTSYEVLVCDDVEDFVSSSALKILTHSWLITPLVIYFLFTHA